MNKPTKKEMEEYNKHLEESAKNFKLTPEDLGNLYDLTYVVNWQDYETIKLNKMGKWFKKFFGKIEEIVLPELSQNETLASINKSGGK